MTNIIFENQGVKAEFLPSGDLLGLTADEMMINQLDGQSLDGSLVQLYLRVHEGDEMKIAPMIGSNAQSYFNANQDGAYWQGEFEGVTYQVAFTLSQGVWYWTVNLNGTGQKADVLFGQDLGNAARGAVQSNEAYMSQYLDHKISQTELGYVISSRQNQTQSGRFPVVEQGSLTKNVAFSTDGYQFFGKEYKLTEVPAGLYQAKMANEVYQYEFAYTVLQSELVQLNEAQSLVFYGVTKATQETPIREILFSQTEIAQKYQAVEFPTEMGHQISKQIGKTIVGLPFSKEAINEYFPKRKLEEVQANQLLSFFTEQDHHVVLQEKEVLQERTTGHILLSGMDLSVDQPPMSTTAYIYGIFNSQIVLGNTSMNKLMSNSRNSLNLQKLSGQRIYLKNGDVWHNLGMPSAFEMGLNSAAWYYQLADDLLTVTTYTSAAGHDVVTTFASQQGKNYTIALTNHLLMSGDETSHVELTRQGKLLTIKANQSSVIQSEYPELTYYFNFNHDFELTNESIFGITGEKLTVMVLENLSDFEVTIQGNLTGAAYIEKDLTVATENQIFANHINDLIKGFKLTSENMEVASINTLTRWYTHNMLVHYLSPHGLEQYGGAAWGTRDVSQGPTEFFLTMDRPEIVKDIIQHIFANQFSDDGNWPQWFMFDRYETQKADESHGDVIVWPMKVVADYLDKTQDFSILDLEIPYSDRTTFLKTEETASLLAHLQKEIAYIENNFLPGTYLSCYGDGDWDDTLQPYDSRLKKNMASSWTVALTYQVIGKLAEVLAPVEATYAKHLGELAELIKGDYEKYMLGTEVIPGFVYLEKDQKPELMIHPTDAKTGIHYRLLPMTRSMIAGLLTPEQAAAHFDVIKENLYFPDGVRLMDRPANYDGGVSTNFKRAEQSANFGREIGLQYVHAHIRFTEAMAKLGKTDETWKALQTIDPIQIKERVANAGLRQANVYFSSSDGDFKTRYEAQQNFGKLRDGAVTVKGGWRVYSSGPGIYLNQLLSNVLGVRQSAETVTFDPILPAEFNETRLELEVAGVPVTIKYHLGHQEQALKINGSEIAFEVESNPYRQGGMAVKLQDLQAKLQKNSIIDIYR